jgi:hypothetical protein
MEQQRASLLLEQQRASLEQQRAPLLLQMPFGPQGGHNNVAATQQLLPQMLHEPAEAPTLAPTTASSLNQVQVDLIAANREAALRRRQQQLQPQVQLQPQQQEHLQDQQQEVETQVAVAQQTQLEITTSHGGICGEQQQPSVGLQSTAQYTASGNTNKCIICMEDLHILQVQALPCMHCFHKVCLDEWRQCADKPAHHCPLKCHLTMCSLLADDTADEAEHQIGGDGSSAQQRPDPSAPVGDELSQLIAEATAR